MSQNFNHPLSALSASEIEDAVSVLKNSNKEHENSSFSYISIEEPDKKLLKEKSNLDRLVKIVGVDHVDIKLVWDPPWTKDKMTEAAKLELNL